MTRRVYKTKMNWPGNIRTMSHGRGWYIRIPVNVMRSFLRKLPREAHTAMDGIIVDITVEWEGLIDE